MKDNNKLLVYEILSAIIIGISAWWQLAIKTSGHIENGYRLAYFGFFIVAFLILCTVNTVKNANRKLKKQYKSVLRFGTYYSIGMFAFWIVNFIIYGGLSGTFEEAGYRAANIMLIILSLLPLAPMVAMGIKAFFSKDDDKKKLKALRIVAIGIFVLYILLIVFGVFFRTVTYVAPENVRMY